MNIFAELKGGEELKKKLRSMPGAFVAAMVDELPREGAMLKEQANGHVPDEHGTLRASAAVSSELPKGNRGRVRVAVAYTDKKAAAVHEGVHWNRHFKTLHMKWFERAFHAFEGGFVRRIVEKLQGVVGRLGE